MSTFNSPLLCRSNSQEPWLLCLPSNYPDETVLWTCTTARASLAAAFAKQRDAQALSGVFSCEREAAPLRSLSLLPIAAKCSSKALCRAKACHGSRSLLLCHASACLHARGLRCMTLLAWIRQSPCISMQQHTLNFSKGTSLYWMHYSNHNYDSSTKGAM